MNDTALTDLTNVTGSAKTLLENFIINVEKVLYWYKKISWLNYKDVTVVFVKMYKICDHGGFLQSQSQIDCRFHM